jgi:hypothetical protein
VVLFVIIETRTVGGFPVVGEVIRYGVDAFKAAHTVSRRQMIRDLISTATALSQTVFRDDFASYTRDTEPAKAHS